MGISRVSLSLSANSNEVNETGSEDTVKLTMAEAKKEVINQSPERK